MNTSDLWKVNGIMNTSGLLHLWKVNGIMNTSGLLQKTRSIHDSMNLPKSEFIAYIYMLL